jgi:hypothetical protein
MTQTPSAPTTTHRIPAIVGVGPIIVMAAITAALGYQLLKPSSSLAA